MRHIVSGGNVFNSTTLLSLWLQNVHRYLLLLNLRKKPLSSGAAQQANLQIKNVLKYAPYHFSVERDSHRTRGIQTHRISFIHTQPSDANAPRTNTHRQSMRRHEPPQKTNRALGRLWIFFVWFLLITTLRQFHLAFRLEQNKKRFRQLWISLCRTRWEVHCPCWLLPLFLSTHNLLLIASSKIWTCSICSRHSGHYILILIFFSSSEAQTSW